MAGHDVAKVVNASEGIYFLSTFHAFDGIEYPDRAEQRAGALQEQSWSQSC